MSHKPSFIISWVSLKRVISPSRSFSSCTSFNPPYNRIKPSAVHRQALTANQRCSPFLVVNRNSTWYSVRPALKAVAISRNRVAPRPGSARLNQLSSLLTKSCSLSYPSSARNCGENQAGLLLSSPSIASIKISQNPSVVEDEIASRCSASLRDCCVASSLFARSCSSSSVSRWLSLTKQ